MSPGTIAVAFVVALLTTLLVPTFASARCAPRSEQSPDNRFEWQGRLDELVDAYEDAGPVERVEIMRCLADFPASQAKKWLLQGLDEPNIDVQIAAIESLRRVVARDAAELIAKKLSAREADVRVAAARALGGLGAREYVDQLISALSDPSGDVKQAAIHALGALRDPIAIAPLTGMLDEDARDVVVAALEELGSFADRTTVYDILDKTHDSSRAIRAAAVTALGKLRDPRATHRLVAMLKGQPDEVRRAAVRSLAAIGDPEAVELLHAMLNANDAESSVPSIVRALGKLGDERSVTPLLSFMRHGKHVATVRSALRDIGSPAVPRIVEELERSEDLSYQSELLRVLADIPATEAAGVLEQALVSERYPREHVVAAIGSVRDPEMVGVLALVIPDLSDRELEAALMAVGHHADDRLVVPLVERYPDLGARARLQVLHTFAAAGSADALPIVTEEIGNEDLTIRRLAVHAAQAIGSDEVVDELAFALETDDGALRRQAAVALASVGGAKAVDALLAVARDSDHPARRDATWALAFAAREASDKAQRDALAFASGVLEDPEHPLTYTALEIAGTLGPDSVRQRFGAIYEDGRISVRRKVVEMIGVMKATESGDLVLDALTAEDDTLRAEAAWVAGTLQLQEAVPQLSRLAEDPTPPVAVNAISALDRIGAAGDARDVLERRLYDASPYVVASALRALHSVDATPARWELELALEKSANPFLHETVYRVLIDEGEREVLDELLAREKNRILAEEMRALAAGETPSTKGLDDWVVIDLSQEKVLERVISEEVYLFLPSGHIKAAFTDENGKVRLELEAPGRVKQLYGTGQHVPFPDEPRQ